MFEDEEYLESIFEENYRHEHERKEKIFSSLAFPTTITTAFGGVAAFYANALIDKNFQIEEIHSVLFVVLVALSFIFVIMSMFFILKAAYKHDYQYIPSPTSTLKYAEETKVRIKSQKVPNPEYWVKVYVRRMLLKKYIACIDSNSLINNDRIKYRSKSFSFIILSFYNLVICVFPYYMVIR